MNQHLRTLRYSISAWAWAGLARKPRFSRCSLRRALKRGYIAMLPYLAPGRRPRPWDHCSSRLPCLENSRSEKSPQILYRVNFSLSPSSCQMSNRNAKRNTEEVMSRYELLATG